MTPILLRTFLAVMNHRSIRGAAREIHLSQPAVTRQVQQLEADLGVLLFDRIGRSIQPTEAAHELHTDAERLLGDVSRISEKMARFRSVEHGRLRLGASTTPGLYVLPPILGRFLQQHQQVELSYSVSNSADVQAQLQSNQIDLGFVGDEPQEPTMTVEATLPDELVCIAHAAHPLAGRRRLRLQQLASETWILREQGSASRRIWERWLRDHDIQMKRTLELRHPEEVKGLVRAGVGLSIISAHALATEPTTAPSLSVLAISGLKLRRKIRMIRHRNKQLSPTVQAFVETTQQVFAPTHGA